MRRAYRSPRVIFGPPSATEKIVCSALRDATSCHAMPYAMPCDTRIIVTYILRDSNCRLSAGRYLAMLPGIPGEKRGGKRRQDATNRGDSVVSDALGPDGR